MCFLRKALDNMDLNQMSYRYVSGALQNDWNDPLDFRSLDRSQRGCCIWVYIVWVIKWSIWSFPVYITQKNLKSVIDSAVLHWTTRLVVFTRHVGFSACLHVTKSSLTSTETRNLTGTRLPLRKNLNEINPARVQIPSQFYCCHYSLKQLFSSLSTFT